MSEFVGEMSTNVILLHTRYEMIILFIDQVVIKSVRNAYTVHAYYIYNLNNILL